MWSLLLLVIAAFVTETTLDKFGCTFMDDESDPHPSYQIYPYRSVFETVYGDKVEPMNFTNVREFLKIMDGIQTIYSTMMEKYVHDDFLDFYGFYIMWQKDLPNMSFEDFYHEYIPKFLPYTNCVSWSIQLLNDTVSIFDDIKEHCYLVTTTKYVTQNETSAIGLIRDVKKNAQNSHERNPQESKLFTHNHVAAAINFTIEGRAGIILLDIVPGISGPVVIMDDECFPHMYSREVYEENSKSSECGYGCTRILLFFIKRILRRKNSDRPKTRIPFREQDSFRIPSLTQKIDSGTFVLWKEGYIFNRIDSTNYLYYIGLPYCSFMMSTVKRHLLMNPLRSIVRRDMEGRSTASISYNMMSTTSLELKVTLVENNREYTKDIKMLDTQNMTEEEWEHYNSVTKKINCTKICEQHLQSAKTIANDVAFIEEYKRWKDYMKNVIEEGKESNYEHF